MDYSSSMWYPVDADPRGPGCNWVRTEEGWRNIVNQPTFTSADDDNRIQTAQINSLRQHNASDGRSTYSVEVCPWATRQPHIGQIRGTANLRKAMISLSDAFRQLEIYRISTDIQGLAYCVELFETLLRGSIKNLSGSTQREIFRILQSMVNKVIERETNIQTMKRLLLTAAESLKMGKGQVIGSRSLWKNQSDIVNGMITRLNNFQYTERQPDGLPTLLDLPKECLHNILLRLTDHRDLANVRGTCGYLRDLCNDPTIWRTLSLLHFSEKQLYDFISGDEDWEFVFRSCLRKHKTLRRMFADELCFCNLCRSVYWKNIGHPCAHTKALPWSSSLSPSEFVGLFSI